jgi:hypothetical protein
MYREPLESLLIPPPVGKATREESCPTLIQMWGNKGGTTLKICSDKHAEGGEGDGPCHYSLRRLLRRELLPCHVALVGIHQVAFSHSLVHFVFLGPPPRRFAHWVVPFILQSPSSFTRFRIDADGGGPEKRINNAFESIN